MAKDYKKIYLRLKQDIQKQVKLYYTYKKPWNKENFIEQIELDETINTLESIQVVMDELEGKYNHGVIFTNTMFKSWKNKINKNKK